MKTLRSIILSLVASLLLFACGGNSPESVVEKYAEASKRGDFKAVQECLTKSAAAKFDQLISILDEDDLDDMKKKIADLGADNNVKIVRSEVNEETAAVYAEEVHGDHSHEKKISLVKEDGERKISILY